MTLASRCQPTSARAWSDSLVDDIDLQRSDSGNLDLELVAAFHPERRLAPQADAVWRAGGDHVARLQPGHRREVLDDGGDIEDHVIGRVALDFGAIEAGHQHQRLR